MTRRHPIATVLLLTSATVATLAATDPAAASPAPPPPDAQVKKELLDLRARMMRSPRAEARANASTFRALCDQWGYPLVGNLAAKSDAYQPSQLCADVRRSERR